LATSTIYKIFDEICNKQKNVQSYSARKLLSESWHKDSATSVSQDLMG